jgi:carboxymethylenebutenolidase
VRDDDRLLDLPAAEFGSGIIGVCDICGTRQAVVVLSKERYKLCVIDFLNKTWIKSEKKPGVPAPLYKSDRIWFETRSTTTGRAPGIVLSPTKIVRHPVVLITPDTFGLTTTLLDGAIRLAREGFEVFLPDLMKTDGVGGLHHMSLRTSGALRGGVTVEAGRTARLVDLYVDALAYLRSREMVDPAKSAVLGTSYGASLALAVAARDTRLAAVALAYPIAVKPPDLARLVTAPLMYIGGSHDRAAWKAREQLSAVHREARAPFQFYDVPGARHDFLSRDLAAYDLQRAEATWGRIVAFLREQLMPPPPRPPPPPVKETSADPLSAPPARRSPPGSGSPAPGSPVRAASAA